MTDARASALWRWFGGKTNIYVVQQADGHYLTNGKLGLPALTPEDMDKHVLGRHTLAVYPVMDDHNVTFGVIDFDSKTGAAKERILWVKRFLAQLGIPTYLEGSGSKGYHLWWVLKSLLPAAKIQWVLRYAVQAAEGDMGAPGLSENGKSDWIEVNPKQRSGAGSGSAVKLPWGIHRKTGKRTTLINDEFTAELPNHGIDAIEAQEAFTAERLDAIIEEYCPMPAEEEKPRQSWEHSEEFQELAVGLLIERCSFLQHCRAHAATLSEPHWWGMIRQLVPFGEPGRRKIHDLSAAYPKYSERDTDRKIDACLKASEQKDVGPHTCMTIKGFYEGCGDECWAPGLGVASPAGMASRLASQEMAKSRTDSIQVGKKGKEVKVNCVRLAEEIMKDHIFKTFKDTDECLVYRDGLYVGGGVVVIRREVEERLGEFSSERKAAEVYYHIKVKSYEDREAFNQLGHIINLKNGLLDLNSMELLPHTPKHLSTIRVPVAYDSTATCPTIDKFLAEVLPRENITTFEELCGYCLESDYYISRAFLFTGEGANGKSCTIELLRTFLGPANCTTVPLQFLENSRFSSSGLYGKLANLYADLPTTAMNHIGTFKMLTGGDFVHAEKKYGDAFDFKNVAKLVFSANQVPEVKGEDSVAFWRRWILVRFPNQFLGDAADKHLIRKLTTEAELSGFLNVVLQALQGLRRRGEFQGALSPEDTQQAYTKAANPILAFVSECCEIDGEAWTTKDDLYGAYKVYCDDTGLPMKGKDSFGRSLAGSTYGNQIKTASRRINGKLTHGWAGVSYNGSKPGEVPMKTMAEWDAEKAAETKSTDTPENDAEARLEF